MPIEFKLPELGENVAAGDVVRVLVSAGDVVAKEQPLLELETDKATIEVPSNVAGRIRAIAVKAGDKVKVGQVVLTIEESDGFTAEPQAPRLEPAPLSEPKATREAEVVEFARPAPRPVPVPSRVEAPVPSRVEAPVPEEISAALAPAAPSVRRLARDLGVDISRVSGSGPGGRIAPEDVKDYAKAVVSGSAGSGMAAPAMPLPDFAKWGPVERRAMSGVRRKTAEHLAQSWRTIPHVSQHDAAG